MSSEKEVEKAREELKELNRENTERLRILGESLLLSTETSEQSAKQIEFLKNDILKFQATARSAHANYERELQLHAKAEKDLKDLETGTCVLQLRNFWIKWARSLYWCSSTPCLQLFVTSFYLSLFLSLSLLLSLLLSLSLHPSLSTSLSLSLSPLIRLSISHSPSSFLSSILHNNISFF